MKLTIYCDVCIQIYKSLYDDSRIVNLSTALCNAGSYNNQYHPRIVDINLSKPTGHVMHQQFNIQQLYALPTLYLCVLYLSENKQRLVPLTA